MTKVEDLKNRYQGEKILVVACGPSASRWKVLNNLSCEYKHFATIKQSIALVPIDNVTFQFFNSIHTSEFLNSKISPRHLRAKHTICTTLDRDPAFPPDLYDISFPLTLGLPNTPVAKSRMIDQYSIENFGLQRPWGPGIMYEIVFYLLAYAGFSHIDVIGFDCGSKINQKNDKKVDLSSHNVSHFYTNDASFRQNNSIPSVNRDQYISNTLESELIADAIPDWYMWLQSRSIDLRIFTDFSGFVAPELPYTFKI